VKHGINQKMLASRPIGLFVIGVLLILLPFLLKSPYIMHIVIMTFIGIVLGMTFSMIYSVGRISLGAGAFYAIGAYASALLAMKLGLSFWFALPLATIITGMIALGLGSVILKGSGLSFGVISLLFALVIVQATGQVPFFGGWGGFWGIPAPDPIPVPLHSPIEFVSKTPYYYLILSLFLLIVLSFHALYTSRIGRTWRAIKLSPHLAETLGINLYRYRLLAFVIASTAAGVVGSFFSHYNRVIEPGAFGGFFSIYIQLYSVLGGLEFYILGPVVGSTIVTFVPEFLRIAEEFEPIITGVVLVVVILFFPGGILGTLQKFPRFDIASIFARTSKGFKALLLRAGNVRQ
jgi:branched-chain amino acid transport system permease protein